MGRNSEPDVPGVTSYSLLVSLVRLWSPDKCWINQALTRVYRILTLLHDRMCWNHLLRLDIWAYTGNWLRTHGNNAWTPEQKTSEICPIIRQLLLFCEACRNADWQDSFAKSWQAPVQSDMDCTTTYLTCRPSSTIYPCSGESFLSEIISKVVRSEFVYFVCCLICFYF